ncbi:MAG: peptide deformylase [Ignavibacteriae bacterium]|nr:peptide deformylase [Ignavibacteriota bacterium]
MRKKAKPVKQLTDDVVKLCVDMIATMHNAHGIGLAANQVGELQRVLVIDLGAVEESVRGDSEEEAAEKTKQAKPFKSLIMINPEILQAEGNEKMEEGCLSIPELRADVERPDNIRVRFRDGNFKEMEMDVEGLLARVMQHEIDHLDGVLFFDHISKTQQVLLKPKLSKIKKGDVEASYPVVTGVEV